MSGSTTPPSPNHAFGSDNTAGICPDALAGLTEANAGYAGSYGDDAWTTQARALFRELFETDCEVYFAFNGTAANCLALSACCRAPYTRVICHDYAHVDTDECGAPEFFTGGAKLTPIAGPAGKLTPALIEPALHRGHGIHYPKPAALSLTQSTEWGTVYQAEELQALADFAHARGMAVHVDGARFANAMASLLDRAAAARRRLTPADVTWRAGVDVLCFGGTKNGMHTTEAVVLFNRELAKEFEYRVKQSGQLASKMRFAAGQWVGMLRDGAWLRHARHANAQTRRLADGLRRIAGYRVIVEPEVNGLFVEMPPAVFAALQERGWQFYRFIGENGYRLMCSWATTDAEVDAFLADARRVTPKA